LSSAFASGGLKKIVFIAGKDSHGHGEHEYRAGCHLLAKALNKSGLKVKATVVEDGWPKDESVFKGASSIIVFSSGREKHPFLNRFEQVDKLVSSGVGIGFFHDSFNVETEKEAEYVKKWIGGHYERGFSTNPKWEMKAELEKSLDVNNGITSFKLFDEWHFNIRFDESVKLIHALKGKPDSAARSGMTSSPRGPMQHIVDALGREETLLWLKDEKSRGFGFTGGHYHHIWKHQRLRTLVLNAIVWSAGLKVPKNGVKSNNPTQLELSYRMSPSPEKVTWTKEMKKLKGAKLQFKSSVLKGSDKNPSINKSVNVKGAKELILMVLDGGNGIRNDHAGWLNPSLKMTDGSTKKLTEFNWEVGITGWREIKVNKGVETEKLLYQGKEVKGISTHSLSIIRYKLPENVESFNVDMAVLDSSKGKGSIQFEIYTN